MGVIAMRPMLNAGYDVRLASGAITAGGTLGILIPPSVMLIVYAAVAGQSIVKLYAAAMLPGFFLTFLYLVYILGLGAHQPEDRAQAAARPVPRRGARVSAAARARPRRGASCRASSPPLCGRPCAGPPSAGTRRYGLIVKNLLGAVGALAADGRHLRRDVVVRRRLQRARGGRRSARAGRAGAAPAPPAPTAAPRRAARGEAAGARRGGDGARERRRSSGRPASPRRRRQRRRPTGRPRR